MRSESKQEQQRNQGQIQMLKTKLQDVERTLHDQQQSKLTQIAQVRTPKADDEYKHGFALWLSAYLIALNSRTL